MKVSVIGLGSMGKNHVRVYKAMGVLSSVCDTDSILSQVTGEANEVEWFNSIDKLLETKPDAVSIVVPTPFHFGVALKCLQNGCHVLLEKPITTTAEEAQELIELAQEKNLIFTVGYLERYNPAFLYLQDLINENKLGSLTSVNIKRVGGTPRSADNIIVDLMTHDFNLLTALFSNSPSKIHVHFSGRNDIVDSAQVLLDFEYASATCESNWISPIKIRTIQVTGTMGYCEVDLMKQQVSNFTSDSVFTKSFNEEPLRNELLMFLSAVKTGNMGGLVTGDNALETLCITAKAIGEKNESTVT